MFPWHDRTRRFICRAVFLLGAVLPMLGMLGWCLWMRSPSRSEAVRAKLESALGLSVRVANVSYPRPGCTLLKDVELADVDAGRTVASARLVEINDDAQGETIFASQPDIDTSATARWQALIEDILRRPVNANSKSLRMAAGELTLHWLGGAQTFVNCNAQFESTADGATADATLGLANSNAVQPIRFQWRRLSVTGEPVANLKLQADGAALPLPLLAALAGRENHCGPHSTLEGTLTAMETPNGWQAELVGQLKNVDLHWVVSEQFPHQLSGNAELNMKHAVVHAGRLEELEGTIHAGPGTVSRSLLAAAVASLGLRSDELDKPHTRASQAISYEELAAEFTCNGSGLSLHGACANQPGVIMRGTNNVLLADSNRGPVPVVALVKMLVPDSRVQVPATRQTDWLLNLLPIPDIVPGDPQAVPQARFRGGKDLH